MPTSDVLPPLYAKWMDDLLGAEIPQGDIHGRQRQLRDAGAADPL